MRILIIPGLFLLLACGQAGGNSIPSAHTPVNPEVNKDYASISEIPPPGGFVRVSVSPESFPAWLRTLTLKKDNRVFLYDGTLKRNQSAQFAVLDIPVGKKDLQQCADVVMRLRAEYLFAQRKYGEIAFMDYNGKWYRWEGGADRIKFESYLATVFGWCGSASLEKQLKPVSNSNEMQAGDVFVKGGFPGHAMIVVDMAINEKGEKVFMLVQGYQPAQDIHIVKNPLDAGLSPWYELKDLNELVTPEWRFLKDQLRKW
jgi:hypothetical protein